ncbi:MAG: hypothetical protein P9X22_04505 [Candidatus Zapsychrus exili]|nr:hypothetical protein [Candidatus Zapsychrus exili]
MSRDDIYDHLAQVYLGKRKEVVKEKKKKFSAWLVINIFTTIIIFLSVVYGLTAFLAQKGFSLKSGIIFSLHRGPIRVEYNFEDSFPPVKTFSLSIPNALNAKKYSSLQFSVRAKEEGTPGVIKIILKNRKNEESFYYIQNINLKWQKINISLDEFRQITDWSNLTDISFVLESWNVDDDSGIILIDDVCFGGIRS